VAGAKSRSLEATTLLPRSHPDQDLRTDREHYAAMNAQMDAEQHERMYPLRAYEDALGHNRIDGVVVSTPDAEADWMKEATE
jgi:hypothetical protein